MTVAGDLRRAPGQALLAGVRVTVVEDHALVGRSLCIALAAEGAQVLAAELAGADGVVAQCVQHRAGVVLLDLALGENAVDGASFIAPLVEAGSRVVVVTGSRDEAELGACLEAGAVGIVDKCAGLDVLVETVRRVAAGQPVVALRRRLALLARHREAKAARRAVLAPFEALTQREAQVFAALLHGHAVAEISRELLLATTTVRSHVRAILLKLGVRSQLAAVGRARDAGWRPPDPLRVAGTAQGSGRHGAGEGCRAGVGAGAE